jgi:hypothetical protein
MQWKAYEKWVHQVGTAGLPQSFNARRRLTVCFNQIRTLNYRHPPRNINRSKLATELAKRVQWFSKVSPALKRHTDNPGLSFRPRLFIPTESGRCGSRTHVGKVLLQAGRSRRRSLAARCFGKSFPIVMGSALAVDPSRWHSASVLKSSLFQFSPPCKFSANHMPMYVWICRTVNIVLIFYFFEYHESSVFISPETGQRKKK